MDRKEKPTRIDELSFEIESVKIEISRLQGLKESLEKDIIEEIGQKTEGSRIRKGSYYSATTTAKIYRKIDKKKLQSIKDDGLIPGEALESLIKVDYKIDTKSYRDFHETNPDYANIFDLCVTETPGKTSVIIKKIEDK